MQEKLNFVPRILLCGDEAEFVSRVGERPHKIVGHAQVIGNVKDEKGGDFKLNFAQNGKVFFNGKLQDISALKDFLQSGEVDYFVFNKQEECRTFGRNAKNLGSLLFKLTTLNVFIEKPLGFYYEKETAKRILWQMNFLKFKTLLDMDGYFSEGKFFTKLGNRLTEIDSISEKPLLPIMENIYAHVYKSFDEIKLKRYDAILIAECSPEEFEKTLTLTKNSSDKIIVFAQTGSELENYLQKNADRFDKDTVFSASTGSWHVLVRSKAPEDFCIQVVTHKALPPEHVKSLPEGYKVIHAGRAIHGDCGYPGDNTGDNISDLNLYLNEMTALYWMWKNTSYTTLGLVHYRRFFTDAPDATFAYEKILTKEAALKLLERYDIIVLLRMTRFTLTEDISNGVRSKVRVKTTENILKKYLMQTQPDYLDAFEEVFNGSPIQYNKNMLITRRNVFDAYCSWLFSFFIDATKEIMKEIPLQEDKGHPQRLIGFFAEHMHTVWLMKNHLRIKELKIMKMEGI